MTRKELIRMVVLQARANGFEFRKWYEAKAAGDWTTAEAAVGVLARGRRYYALLFSHEFARCFWKAGRKIQFLVPTQKIQRVSPDGSITTYSRKAFTRRTLRPNSWEYHIKEMAATEEPLSYIRRFLLTQEELAAQTTGQGLEVTDQPDPNTPPPNAKQHKPTLTEMMDLSERLRHMRR